MTDRDAKTDALRERLTDLLAEWGTEMSAVITELDEARQRLRTVDDDPVERDRAVADLTDRVRGQEELITALQADAEAVPELRREVNARDVEVERLKSELERLKLELESKHELIRGLRREAEETDRLKAEVRRKDHEITALRREKSQLESEGRELRRSVEELEQSAAQESADDTA